ncbi:hypothetical protein [Sutterella wadsworthensis]
MVISVRGKPVAALSSTEVYRDDLKKK